MKKDLPKVKGQKENLKKGEIKMPKCEFCGEIIRTDEEFILAGKYPGGGNILLHSGVIRWAPPETYGKIYHKACFLKLCKKEQEGDENGSN